MYTLLIVIHVLICFLMVGAILLQSGKGAEIGASFGGSSQTVFGSRGPANFLSKFTVAVAAVTPDAPRSRLFQFVGDREQVKFQASQAALDLVRRMLLR